MEKAIGLEIERPNPVMNVAANETARADVSFESGQPSSADRLIYQAVEVIDVVLNELCGALSFRQVESGGIYPARPRTLMSRIHHHWPGAS